MSDQGFIGETEARLQGALGVRQLWEVSSWLVLGCECKL
jgi:hypothetical protein